MNRKPKYFRDNIEISADQALDARGIVRPGVTVRTPMFAMDSVPKSGFHIADDGQVYKDGRPYKVPLQLCDDGVARPTLDKQRKKVLGPNGEIENPDEEDPKAERIESDAAPALLADGTTVESHRPHFGVIDRAAQERMEALRVTLDYIDGERWRGGHSGGAPVVDAASGGSIEDALRAYDAEMGAAYLKNK